ncbi:MAG: hypothetical protein V2I43_05465 [Parvularcula sp.]|jgi:hypothetical protein|nr:hypothetical protein [Parvularcula sp.]
MSWRITNHPAGGLQIEHLASPRFTARWTTGNFPFDQVEERAFFWTDEGSRAEDAIHLFGFAWIDVIPDREALTSILAVAIATIDTYIVADK